MFSPSKKFNIKISIAYNLGELKGCFQSRYRNKDECYNDDEAHFVFNVANGKTLASIGDREVTYADFLSSMEPITKILCIKGWRENGSHTRVLFVCVSNICQYKASWTKSTPRSVHFPLLHLTKCNLQIILSIKKSKTHGVRDGVILNSGKLRWELERWGQWWE